MNSGSSRCVSPRSTLATKWTQATFGDTVGGVELAGEAQVGSGTADLFQLLTLGDIFRREAA